MAREGGRGVDVHVPRPDLIDRAVDHEARIRAIETGAHPVRPPDSNQQATPWFAITKATGFTGSIYWRMVVGIIQLRGLLEVPGGFDSGDVGFALPEEACPAWPLDLVTATAGGGMGIVHLTTNGSGSIIAAGDIYLDGLRYPRG